MDFFVYFENRICVSEYYFWLSTYDQYFYIHNSKVISLPNLNIVRLIYFQV